VRGSLCRMSLRRTIGHAGAVLLAAMFAGGANGADLAPRAVRISADAPHAFLVESCIAVDPTDASTIVVAAMELSGDAGIVVYTSRDGGKTWKRGRSGARTTFPGLDPTLAFADSGTLYFGSLTPEFRVWTAAADKTTFTPAGRVPGSPWDRGFLATHGHELHAVGKLPVDVLGHGDFDAIARSVSRDRAATFSDVRLTLPPPEREALRIASDAAVTEDGTLLVPFQTVELSAQRKRHLRIIRFRGGRTDGPYLIADHESATHDDEVLAIKGQGGGRIAIDRSSGERRGHVYAVWLDLARGRYDVMLASSNDGRVWSEPVIVNRDETHANHSNPAVAVDGRGVVAVVWNDRSDDPADLCYRPVYATSVDGGRSFSRAQPLVSVDTCPAGQSLPAGELDPTNPAVRFLNGGDTQGLAGLGHGFVAAPLAAVRAGGPPQLWFARFGDE
jgi:hypothetical protein